MRLFGTAFVALLWLHTYSCCAFIIFDAPDTPVSQTTPEARPHTYVSTGLIPPWAEKFSPVDPRNVGDST